MFTVKNKEGKDFACDEEIVEGIERLHNIRLKDLMPQLYGTGFSIKFVHYQDPRVFKFFTNDDRDPVIFFGERTFPVFRLEMYGNYEGEDAIIELFRRTLWE